MRAKYDDFCCIYKEGRDISSNYDLKEAGFLKSNNRMESDQMNSKFHTIKCARRA